MNIPWDGVLLRMLHMVFHIEHMLFGPPGGIKNKKRKYKSLDMSALQSDPALNYKHILGSFVNTFNFCRGGGHGVRGSG